MFTIRKKGKTFLLSLLAIAVVFSMGSIAVLAEESDSGQQDEWCDRTGFEAWYEESKAVANGADHVIGPEGDLNTGSYYNVILPGETVAIIPMDIDLSYGIQGGIMSFGFTIYQMDNPEIITEYSGYSSLPYTGYPSKTELTPLKTDVLPVPYGARGEDLPDDPVGEYSGISSVQYTSLYRNDTGHPIVTCSYEDAIKTKYRDAGEMWGGRDSDTKFQGFGRINYAPKFFFLEPAYDFHYEWMEECDGVPLEWPDDMSPLPTKFYIDDQTRTYRFANPVCEGMWFDCWDSGRESGQHPWYYGEATSRGYVWTKDGLETKWYPTYTDFTINAAERIRSDMSSLYNLFPSNLYMHPRFTSYGGSCKTVRFNAQGGTVKGKAAYLCECSDGVGVSSAYTFNLDIGKIIPEKEGFTFAGWCTDQDNPEETLIQDTKPENSSGWVQGKNHVELYAVWSEKQEAINIASAEISGLSSQTYTGKELKPAPVVKLGRKTLVKDTDYTIAYKNNINVGTATLTITGKGNYTGTVSVTFKITQASSDQSSGGSSDGSGGSGNSSGGNSGSGGSSDSSGGSNNSGGTTTKPISKATIASIGNKTYTGKAIKPAITVNDGSVTLKNGTDYTVSYKNNINVGTATVTVTGKGNYTGSKTVTFKITAASIAKAAVSGITAKTYTGSAIAQTLVVKLGSVTLKSGTDYTVAYSENINAGTAKVTVKGKGNYTGSVSTNFAINKAANTLTAKAKAPAVKYRKLKKKNQTIAIKKAVTVKKAKGKVTYKKAKGSKKITVDKETGKITVKKGLKKGSYKVKLKVTAKGDVNYKSGSKTVTVKITIK